MVNKIKKAYKTNDVAKIIGIHSNTVRMYEEWGLISKPIRKGNGYRIFTDMHIEQLKLARIALKIEVIQNGLRKKIISAVKECAKGNYDKAICLTSEYIIDAQIEINNANEAVTITNELLNDTLKESKVYLKRKEVSDKLNITMDTLRNWEMNGLVKVKRKENGYRVYTEADIQRLKVIRTLRCANYSLSAILRMLNALSRQENVNVYQELNTPDEADDIISACDKLIISLKSAKENAEKMTEMLLDMKTKYSNPPL